MYVKLILAILSSSVTRVCYIVAGHIHTCTPLSISFHFCSYSKAKICGSIQMAKFSDSIEYKFFRKIIVKFKIFKDIKKALLSPLTKKRLVYIVIYTYCTSHGIHHGQIWRIITL